MDLSYLEGKKICLVFVKADASDPDRAQCRFLFGRANWDAKHRRLSVEHQEGAFTVPPTCYTQIFPNEGDEPQLRDAEYYILCRVDGMEL
ncbi:MAG: hypothetical protein D6820_16180 [Lentisphaerae bacterium]|nr:MAG: hypothetical protein D6820_16180 [Lentisphaerota bacterium]